MARVNVVNRVFRLKNGQKLQTPFSPDALDFPDAQEFHIVADVIYMGGFPLPIPMQQWMIDWVLKNPILFVEDTRNF